MARKTKGFDCVEMKRRAQVQLRREYEARASEFASVVEFLNQKAAESETGRALRARRAPRRPDYGTRGQAVGR